MLTNSLLFTDNLLSLGASENLTTFLEESPQGEGSIALWKIHSDVTKQQKKREETSLQKCYVSMDQNTDLSVHLVDQYSDFMQDHLRWPIQTVSF